MKTLTLLPIRVGGTQNFSETVTDIDGVCEQFICSIFAETSENNQNLQQLERSDDCGETVENGNMFDLLFEENKETPNLHSSGIHGELSIFNATRKPTRNILEFWRNVTQYKSLRLVARIILSIPATSAGIERLFSECGIILSKMRRRINPQNLQLWLIFDMPRNIESILMTSILLLSSNRGT